MDAAYEWQCAQVGVPAHPRFMRDLLDYTRCAEAASGTGQPEALCLGKARNNARNDPPIRDVDVVAICLLVRSLARTAAVPPPVHLDFTGQLITSEGAKTIAAVLQVNCGLRAVLLRRTCISDEGAAAIGAALATSSLRQLDLGECGISNTGARLFVRGVRMHGIPIALTALLLDGNFIDDPGMMEIISLIEGPGRPPALTLLSVAPAAPRRLSPEVDAALRVVCELAKIELHADGAALSAPCGVGTRCDTSGSTAISLHTRPCTEKTTGPHGATGHDDHSCGQRVGGGSVNVAPEAPLQLQPQYAATTNMVRPLGPAPAPGPNWSHPGSPPVPGSSWYHPSSPPLQGPSQHHLGSQLAPEPRWWHSTMPAQTSSSLQPPLDATPLSRSGSSGQLAAWMAGTERELHELKWLLGASAARLDGQHARLMGELDKLRSQLDAWVRPGMGSNGGFSGDENRLEVLEARFDALERLVGREQSECAQMWQLVEVAAGAGTSDSRLPAETAGVATVRDMQGGLDPLH